MCKNLLILSKMFLSKKICTRVLAYFCDKKKKNADNMKKKNIYVITLTVNLNIRSCSKTIYLYKVQ